MAFRDFADFLPQFVDSTGIEPPMPASEAQPGAPDGQQANRRGSRRH